MPTLKDIIDAPAVGYGDVYDIEVAMEDVARQMGVSLYGGETIDTVRMKFVCDVHYDHTRGARTSVLYYKDTPFAVVSQAGRSLDDIIDVYFLDQDAAIDAVKEFAVSDAKITVSEFTTDVELAYWEHCPVAIGETGIKDPYGVHI